MKQVQKYCLTGSLILALCNLSNLNAQFSLDGEFRPRAEYRHGFGSLIPKGSEPGFSIATRARLNAFYRHAGYSFYLSLQDVFVWGENRQILPADQNNSFSVFQAWAEIGLGSGLSAKLGRQVISYDDQRIFGGLDWAQQGRHHDAALIKYSKSGFLADLGLAFSQDVPVPGGFQSEGNTFNTTGFFTYKTMQYLYLKNSWEKFGGSLLFLNTGFQNFDAEGNGDGVSNLQTAGTHLEYAPGRLSLAGNAFMQFGERQGELEVSGAYLLGLEVNYKGANGPALGVGTELITGNDGAVPGETGAFFPLYGTNHKFNGFMDYFYVGNHANSVGLFDVHASANFNLGPASSLLARLLNFSSHKTLPGGNKSLGTELDLVYSQGFDGFSLKIGYSHMFPSAGMYELKGITEDLAENWQDWAWVMLIIKPELIRPGPGE